MHPLVCNSIEEILDFFAQSNVIFLQSDKQNYVSLVRLVVLLDISTCFVCQHQPSSGRAFFLFVDATAPHWAMVSSFTRFLDHTQRRTTVGGTRLD